MKTYFIPVGEMIISMSISMDAIDKNASKHNRRVAYIGAMIAKEMGLRLPSINEIIIAGALKNIGSIIGTDRHELTGNGMSPIQLTAEYGYRALKISRYFSNIAKMIRNQNLSYEQCSTEEMSIECKILGLATKIEQLIKDDKRLIYDKDRLTVEFIKNYGGKVPEITDTFEKLSKTDSFWLNMQFDRVDSSLKKMAGKHIVEMSSAELIDLTAALSRIIDYRSRYTAVHSSAVSAAAGIMSIILDFSTEESQLIRIAGYLHNLGKLAVPAEITEKKGKLTEEEKTLINTQFFHTDQMLEPVKSLEIIKEWLTVDEYNERDSKSRLGAEIIKACNIYCALREERPYREAYNKETAIEIMSTKVEEGSVDKKVFSELLTNMESIDRLMTEGGNKAKLDYSRFIDLNSYY